MDVLRPFQVEDVEAAPAPAREGEQARRTDEAAIVVKQGQEGNAADAGLRRGHAISASEHIENTEGVESVFGRLERCWRGRGATLDQLSGTRARLSRRASEGDLAI
jgi:hypothetical protein